MTPRNHEGAALGTLTVLCWSGYNVAAKHGIDTGFSPQALAFLRFAVPGLIALPILAALYLRRKDLGIPVTRLMVLVFLGGPIFGLTAVSGYAHAPLSHGLLFAPVAVFVTGGFLGRLLLKERISTNRLIGAGVMFLGLAILVGFETRDIRETWSRGAALFILAGVMWGAYTVFLRLWQIPMLKGLLAVAAGSALVAVPVLGVAASETLMTAPTSSLMFQTIMQGLIGGVVSVVALIGAVRTLSAQVAAVLPIFTPVVALAIAALFLGQVPSVAELIGVAIIASGFVVSVRVPTRGDPSKSKSTAFR